MRQFKWKSEEVPFIIRFFHLAKYMFDNASAKWSVRGEMKFWTMILFYDVLWGSVSDTEDGEVRTREGTDKHIIQPVSQSPALHQRRGALTINFSCRGSASNYANFHSPVCLSAGYLVQPAGSSHYLQAEATSGSVKWKKDTTG